MPSTGGLSDTNHQKHPYAGTHHERGTQNGTGQREALQADWRREMPASAQKTNEAKSV